MDVKEKEIDEESLSGTTIAASTLSEDTIVPPTNTNTGLEHHFFKGNGLSSKATIRTTNGKEYRLVADIHRTKHSHIQFFDGKNTNAPPLGTLEFPHTYNNFQIRIGPSASQQLIQVRARVGHPHPSSYSFTLPATKTSSPQTVAWTKFDPQSNRTGYHLRAEGTNALLASWYLVSNQKHQAVLRWHAEPHDEVIETVIVLSFIGGLSRLKLKGKDDSETPSGLARWNGMWFMAILGTAAVA